MTFILWVKLWVKFSPVKKTLLKEYVHIMSPLQEVSFISDEQWGLSLIVCQIPSFLDSCCHFHWHNCIYCCGFGLGRAGDADRIVILEFVVFNDQLLLFCPARNPLTTSPFLLSMIQRRTYQWNLIRWEILIVLKCLAVKCETVIPADCW